MLHVGGMEYFALSIINCKQDAWKKSKHDANIMFKDLKRLDLPAEIYWKQ